MKSAETRANAPPSPRDDAPPPWFDPGRLIERTLDWMAASQDEPDTAPAPHEAEASAEDALVAWLLRLPDSQDPAHAARELLNAYAPALDAGDPLAVRLSLRLRDVAAYPRERLARIHLGRRRGRPARPS